MARSTLPPDKRGADSSTLRAAAASVAVLLALSIAVLSLMGTAQADGNEAPGAPAAFRSLAVGGGHSCAILTNGDVKCWGANAAGQLGAGDALARGDGPGELGSNLGAIDLGIGRSAVAIATGSAFTCAILDNGGVKCWGQNTHGQLGLGDTLTRGNEPDEMGDDLPAVDLGTSRTAVAITAGTFHTCAVLDNHSLKCWGNNTDGALGYGDTNHRGDRLGEMGDNLPAIQLGTGRTAMSVSAGYSHTCAVLDDGSAKCWGRNAYGQLGYGDIDKRGDAPGEMGNNLPIIELGTGRTASVVTTGTGHTCALLDNGTGKCWGNNVDGQLGYGDTAKRGDGPGEMGNDLPAVDLGTGRTATALSAGSASTCALLDDDTVRCWGSNVHGGLGTGDTAKRGDGPDEMGDDLAPVDLGADRTAIAISTGDSSSCVVLGDDSAKCWGYNADGGLGYGDTDHRGDEIDEMGDDLLTVSLGGNVGVIAAPTPTPTPTPTPRPPATARPPTTARPTATAWPTPTPTGPKQCRGLTVTVDLSANEYPTASDDVIAGTPGDDLIDALGGNDTICSGAGNDTVIAGGGHDTVEAGPGDDTVLGGAGRDTIEGGIGDDTIVAGSGNDRIKGNAGNDTISGGSGNDAIKGNRGSDTIFGGSGNDRLGGGHDGDTIFGDGGSDRLFGGPGPDLLTGGPRSDTLVGSTGSDICVSGAGDTLSGCDTTR